MISCQDVERLTDAYLDGELSPALAAEVHAHGLRCDQCQHRLAILQACGDVIAGDRSGEPSLPEDFADRVMARWRAERRRESLWRVAALRRVAAAAVLVIGLSGVASFDPGPPTVIMAEITQEAPPAGAQARDDVQSENEGGAGVTVEERESGRGAEDEAGTVQSPQAP